MAVVLRYRWIVVLVAVLPLSGCLFRTRTVQHTAAAQLKTATQADLIDYINTQSAKLQTLQATVDIDTSVGGEKKGKVTDYQQIRGYVLARKPAMLRMIGLLPIVRNRAFDMVSDGQNFKLWIPPKNRFVEGRNDVQTPNPKNPLENMRPQFIYQALLLEAINPPDIAVLENGEETVIDKGHSVQQADYEIDVISKGEHGWFLSRKIIFSRTDLLPHRQIIYDETGAPVTESRYDGYKEQGGVNFPWQIEIKRPQEEYDITLSIVKLQLNEPLANEKFEMETPAGAEIVHLGQAHTQARSAAVEGVASR
jgi:outer membrane lipoprotein-sorting protein